VSIWDPKQTIDAVGLGKQGPKRSDRVAEAIRNELSMLMLSKVRDPKLANASFTRVEVTDDLKIARVYFTTLDGKKKAKSVDKALQKAKGFMRSHIASTLNLRYTPALQFRYDETVDKVAEIESIFQEIENERKASSEDT
jgi:ribosome-binding factor A